MAKITWRCGECAGLNIKRILSKTATCGENGKLKTSRACAAFEFDDSVVASTFSAPAIKNTNPLLDLAQIVACLPSDKLRHLSYLLMAEKVTRNCGLMFGQKLYVHYRCNNYYLSNFAIAHVLRATPAAHDKPSALYLVGSLAVPKNAATGCVNFYSIESWERSGVFRPREFTVLKKTKMLGKIDPQIQRDNEKVEREIERGRIEQQRKRSRSDGADEGFVTDLDAAWSNGSVDDTRVKKVKPSTSLLEVIYNMQRGFILAPEFDEPTPEAPDTTDSEIYYQDFDLSFDTRTVK